MQAKTIGFKGLKVSSGGIGALVRWNVSPKKAVGGMGDGPVSVLRGCLPIRAG